ncbi:hypothetical protein T439DRAFT_323861 [Meredithblackwellia eburnea MCA 4105]
MLSRASKSVFSPCSAVVSHRCFAASSRTLAPVPSIPRRAENTAQGSELTKPMGTMGKLQEVVENIPDSLDSGEVDSLDDNSFNRKLKNTKVISPAQLSPRNLLDPRNPRSDDTLAYPLGPPTSEARRLDPFVRLGINPLDSPMNPYLRTNFTTSMGKISSRGKTGLQRSSQRKMGKAVRRARSMGVVAVLGKSEPDNRGWF